MMDLPRASLAIVLLNPGEGNMGGEYLLLNPSLKWVCCCLLGGKLGLVYACCPLGAAPGLLSMLRSELTSIGLMLSSTIYVGKGIIVSIVVGETSLISGCTGAKFLPVLPDFKASGVFLRLFPVVPMSVPTIS